MNLHQLNAKFPVRRTDVQKAEFRAFVMEYAAECGLMASVQTSADGKNENIVVGNPESAKTVLTAHYDTPARGLLPNLMLPRNRGLFYLYQFGIVGILLAISLGVAYSVGIAWLNDTRVYAALFIVLYYGLFFVLLRLGANPHNINDNTSGVAVLLRLMSQMDEAQAAQTALIFFDNEEKGKKGSKAYFKDNTSFMQNKFLVNFDCVGYGEEVVFIAKDGALHRQEYEKLQASFVSQGAYKVQFHSMHDSESNSDYKNFPCGVGCMTCKRSKKGVLYTPYIHTVRDTVASEENIVYLTDGALQWITTLCNE